jgi:hypothetical protein
MSMPNKLFIVTDYSGKRHRVVFAESEQAAQSKVFDELPYVIGGDRIYEIHQWANSKVRPFTQADYQNQSDDDDDSDDDDEFEVSVRVDGKEIEG